MGRSGGGGGGGRSSGGGFSGGGRSSGGFSGGGRSGRSRSGGSSYHSRSSRSYGYSRGYRRGGPVIIGSGFVVVMIVTILVMALFSAMVSGTNVTKSTVHREKLSMSQSQETSYYTDEAGWFTNIRELESGLKSFYHKTGVQPHVYVTDGRYGTSIDELTKLAEDTYDQICSDEAHFVLVFYDNGYGGYNCGYTGGTKTKTIMDREAISILNDYLDHYYNSDVSDEEMFSRAFEKTGNRIMKVTKSPVAVVGVTVAVVGGVVAVVAIGFVWWKKAKAAKLKEAELNAEILNTPLEKMADDELEDLEEKYTKQ